MKLADMNAGQAKAWFRRMGQKAKRVDAPSLKWATPEDRKQAARALQRRSL